MLQLREFSSHMQQLQGALDEVSEEHNKATRKWGETQTHLEKELSTTLQDKVVSAGGGGGEAVGWFKLVLLLCSLGFWGLSYLLFKV